MHFGCHRRKAAASRRLLPPGGAASEDMDGVPVFQLTCGEPGCCISLRLRPEQLGS